MNILINQTWKQGFLDYHRSPDEYRVQVLAFQNLEKLDDIYYVRPKSLRLVWNTLQKVGVREALQKILSRRREKHRNEKFVSWGFGEVIEAPAGSKYSHGQTVAFLAPCHPACPERIVLPEELIFEIGENQISVLKPNAISYFGKINSTESWWNEARGWSVHSGQKISSISIYSDLVNSALTNLSVTSTQASALSIEKNSTITERTSASVKAKKSSGKKSAVLFGYGNYAKTTCLPNLKSYISLNCIHELDPTQIPLSQMFTVSWDAAPVLREDEDYDVFLIAGYHHTHAPLATQALERNAQAVVEKPIAVNEDQLATLTEKMQSSKGELFSCFQKRYSPFNNLALDDLKVKKGERVNYHCVVYEVPLPELHWYRWPNSKSRLVSNGCHWIDHFLFLNSFCPVKSQDLFLAPDGTLNCSLVLKNEAFFSMVLTDQGSQRLGVQDYVELRANGRTVKIIDDARYFSEGKNRVIRKRKINRRVTYKRMYHHIGRKIVAGDRGDSIDSLRVSCGTILALESRLNQIINGREAS